MYYRKRTGGGSFSRAASSRARILIVTRQNQSRQRVHVRVGTKGSLRPYNIKPFATKLLVLLLLRRRSQRRLLVHAGLRRGFPFVRSAAASRNVFTATIVVRKRRFHVRFVAQHQRRTSDVRWLICFPRYDRVDIRLQIFDVTWQRITWFDRIDIGWNDCDRHQDVVCGYCWSTFSNIKTADVVHLNRLKSKTDIYLCHLILSYRRWSAHKVCASIPRRSC